MPTNPGVSEVQDKNGVVADIEAKRFDGTRTVQIQGDVTASQTWNGDSSYPLTLNASIGAKKVTQDKIGDKAVGTGQMADGSVGLTQMAASAMTDTVSANNSKLVTSQGVNAAIAAATLNRGKDYGPMSVDEINAISETIPTGSTVYVESLGASDAKVINDGYSDGTMASFSVEVGEDLKYYRSPDNSLHGWYSTEANVKIKQPANYAGGIAVDSAQDASSGTAGIEFIQSLKQDTNGNIRDIVKAQVDIVDSTSSTRTNAAATPNSVKSAYDLANTANTGAVKNVAYDSTNKKITKTINGTTTDVVSAATLKTDMALNNVDNTSDANKPVSTAQQAALELKLDKTGDGKDVTVSFSEASARANVGTGEKLSVMFGKIKKWFTDLKALAFKDTVSDSDISGTISDNHIASASTWNAKVTGPSSATADDIAVFDGATGKLVKDGGKKISDLAPLASPAFTGTPTAPTAASGTNTTQIATTEFVQGELEKKKCIVYRGGGSTDSNTYKVAEITIRSLSSSHIEEYVFDCAYSRYNNVSATSKLLLTILTNGSTLTASVSSLKNIVYYSTVTSLDWVFKAYADSQTGKLTLYAETIGGKYTTIDVSLEKANSERYDLSRLVTLFSLTEGTIPEDAVSETTLLSTYADGAKGSASVPVYVDALGEVKACTDSFVNNVKYVANQSGGGGNLNKTINGTTTSVLAFMNDSEAVAIWNDAKTAAANAS